MDAQIFQRARDFVDLHVVGADVRYALRSLASGVGLDTLVRQTASEKV